MNVGSAKGPQDEKRDSLPVEEGPPGHVINHDGELSFIAELAAGDHAVKLTIGRPGQGSFASLEEKSIILDPTHCKTREEQRGVAAHEGRHIYDTPSFSAMGFTQAETRELAKQVGTMSGRNLVEDFIVNDGVVRDFPARERDILALYSPHEPTDPVFPIQHPEVNQIISRIGFAPRFAFALAGLLNDWAYLRRHVGFGGSPQEYSKVPFSGGVSDDPSITRFFERNYKLAREAARIIAPAGASGSERIDYARARFTFFRDVLYPELKQLFEKDVEQLAEMIKQALRQQSSKPKDGQGDGGSGSEQRGETPEAGNGPMTDEESKRQASGQLSEIDDAIRDALRGLLTEDDVPSSAAETHKHNEQARRAEEDARKAQELKDVQDALRRAMDAGVSDYLKEYQKVAGSVEEAYGRLAHDFVPLAHYRWMTGMASGARVSLPHAMSYSLSGSGAGQVFMRRIEPTRPDMSIAILVDMSGSMGTDDKYIYARRAVIFAKELFQKLSISTCFARFNESVNEFLSFDDDIQDEDAQQRLLQGCSKPEGSTHDETALRFAEERLRQVRSLQRSIIVISDAESGQGAALSATVRRLESEGLPVLHFGIGRGTSDTANLYTRSWGNLELQGRGERNFLSVFCREMSRVAREALEGPGR